MRGCEVSLSCFPEKKKIVKYEDNCEILFNFASIIRYPSPNQRTHASIATHIITIVPDSAHSGTERGDKPYFVVYPEGDEFQQRRATGEGVPAL